MKPGQVGAVRITPVHSRHIGVAGKDTQHASFIIEGSACIWFTGDASPSQWGRLSLPKPDVLIVPYAYCNTPAAWAATKALGAKIIVLLHMPARSDDSIGLWPAVENTVGENRNLFIPAMNETVEIPILCH
jgi:L-ascorbate metabolism protein UlaG (beta-lactamase superfamily)